jgi:hypothetical protein
MKFNLTPRLHSRLLFLQFKQSGVASSHFKCRSRQVRHPVRTRFDLAGADDGAAPFSRRLDVGPSMHEASECMLFCLRTGQDEGDECDDVAGTFVISFCRFGVGNWNCSMEKHPRTKYGSGSSNNCEAKSSSICIGDCSGCESTVPRPKPDMMESGGVWYAASVAGARGLCWADSARYEGPRLVGFYRQGGAASLVRRCTTGVQRRFSMRGEIPALSSDGGFCIPLIGRLASVGPSRSIGSGRERCNARPALSLCRLESLICPPRPTPTSTARSQLRGPECTTRRKRKSRIIDNNADPCPTSSSG